MLCAVPPYATVTGWYYGCGNRTGHCLWEPGSATAIYQVPGFSGLTLGGIHLDGGFLKANWTKTEGAQPEGVAVLTYTQDSEERPRTVLAFWDRTIDSRPASHSTFVLEGCLPFDQALAQAKALFTQIFDRAPFEITSHPDNPEYVEFEKHED